MALYMNLYLRLPRIILHNLGRLAPISETCDLATETGPGKSTESRASIYGR